MTSGALLVVANAHRKGADDGQPHFFLYLYASVAAVVAQKVSLIGP